MTDSNDDIKKQLRDANSAVKATERKLADITRGRKKLLAWAAIGGVILTVIGGHFYPGYQLDSTAARASAQAADDATNVVLAHLCAQRFLTDEGREEHLVNLEAKKSEYEQHTFLRNGRWGTDLKGDEVANSVAGECLTLIYKSAEKANETS